MQDSFLRNCELVIISYQVEIMSKRARTESGAYDPRAYARRMSIISGKKWPYKDYGRVMVRRGDAGNLARYGASWAEADDAQKANRAADGYMGRGLYRGRGGFFADLAKMAGRGLGGLFGNKDIGGRIGSQLGGMGETLLAKKFPFAAPLLAQSLTGSGLYSGRRWSGRGEYTAANETIAGSEISSPQMISVPDESGSIIISNREYVSDIFAPAVTGSFDNNVFYLNPGLESTFPWLAQIAANYEEYEFIQCIFEFKSAIQDVNSANGQVGTMIGSCNYNPSQPAFTDKPAMVSYYGSVSSKTTDNMIVGVECDPKKLSGSAGRYVRVNPVMSGEDLKTYDHGTFQLATHNIPTSMLNGTLGELYVVYKIKLRKPKFLTGRGLALTRALFVSNGGTSPNQVLGPATSMLRGQQNNLDVLVSYPVTGSIRITFPAYYGGNLELKLCIEYGIAWNNLISGLFYSGNVSTNVDMYGTQPSGNGPYGFINAYGGNQYVFILHLRVDPATNATDNYVQFVTSALGTPSQTMLDIAEYNTSFNSPSSGAPVLVNSAGTVVVPV